VPLDVLERQIDAYIATTRGAGAASAP
jgi:hypothetical protein